MTDEEGRRRCTVCEAGFMSGSPGIWLIFSSALLLREGERLRLEKTPGPFASERERGREGAPAG